MNVNGILFDKDEMLIDLAKFWCEPISKCISIILQEFGLIPDFNTYYELRVLAGLYGNRSINPVVTRNNLDIGNVWCQYLKGKGFYVSDNLPKSISDLLTSFDCSNRVVFKTEPLSLLLNKLKAKGIYLGVATLSRTSSALNRLDTLGIAEKLDYFGTNNAEIESIPYLSILQEFCRLTQTVSSKVMMVGNSSHEMLFAKQSGAIGVFLSSDENKCPEGTTIKISTLNELIKYVDAA